MPTIPPHEDEAADDVHREEREPHGQFPPSNQGEYVALLEGIKHPGFVPATRLLPQLWRIRRPPAAGRRPARAGRARLRSPSGPNPPNAWDVGESQPGKCFSRAHADRADAIEPPTPPRDRPRAPGRAAARQPPCNTASTAGPSGRACGSGAARRRKDIDRPRARRWAPQPGAAGHRDEEEEVLHQPRSSTGNGRKPAFAQDTSEGDSTPVMKRSTRPSRIAERERSRSVVEAE